MYALRSTLSLGAVLAALGAVAPLAAADDDAPVLPSRVQQAITRTTNAIDKAQDHVDDGEYTKAIGSLRAARVNMYRGDRAVARVLAAPPADPEAETTPGVDAAVAFLAAEHHLVVTAAGLFDANSKGVVDALTHAVFRTLNARDKLLDSIIALDPEGAGAAFADGMADTVADYDDEVANVSDALADDQLSAGGRAVLLKVQQQVTATDAKVNAAWGGGE
jgi:hypothetical protein